MKRPRSGRTISSLLRGREVKKYPVKKPGISGLVSGVGSKASPLMEVFEQKRDYSKNKAPDQDFILPERIERGS